MKQVPLVDAIEMIGSLVEGEAIDPAEGSAMLAEFSQGGLTVYGATNLLMNWRTARERYEQS